MPNFPAGGRGEEGRGEGGKGKALHTQVGGKIPVEAKDMVFAHTHHRVVIIVYKGRKGKGGKGREGISIRYINVAMCRYYIKSYASP